ncbi:MAG: hypothetical protein A2516_01765 [Alphaproteobacteria bacterium RIFOXYD12_FULL_60_8]|nr:MAG: hypothetical protein A2516_01765 [Alphaproteobacteria bacterium RIFOXYD12_FULL_60_8]
MADATTTLASQENLLLEYVQRLEEHRRGRSAVHVHIANLHANNRRESHMRMAANTFESLVKSLQGQLFVLSNGDLMFIFKTESEDLVHSAIVKLRFMFADDPLLDDVMESEESAFESWYSMERDFDKLLQNAKTLVEEATSRLSQQAQRKRFQENKPQVRRKEPLTPAMLRRVEHALAQADLSNLVRRQSICAIVGRSPPQPIFSELFVSIADLRDTIIPNVDLTRDRWLFQHMTDTLDRRVLSMLSKHDDRTLDSDISVNLNISTLLTQEFLKFDDNVKAGVRGSIVLELQVLDIFADLSAYQFARDVVHELGYRICIDGLSLHALEYVERDRLGADMLKIFWEPAIAEKLNDPDETAVVQAMLKKNGLSRIVLGRCDTREAIEAGQSLGITLFQGRFVEEGLADDQRKRRVGTVLLIDKSDKI